MFVASVLLAFLPYATSPEAEGVSSRQIGRWLDACEREIDTLHGFVLLRHGKVVAEGSWAPFDTLNNPHFLSSHTKCFITTAIGFLVEDDKLDLDERVVDIFPDKIPANPSENLRMLRVRDLLTMNTGTARDGWHDDADGDWTKAILAKELVRRPGNGFRYDSGATHLLGVIVSRRSGKPVMEFLKERLFSRIGIEKAWTTYDPTGEACTGWGFNMTTREISLIGQLYLDKGVWNGQRLFSEEWARLATTKQTWSGKKQGEHQEKNDWLQGFGFNFWRCRHGCFRADGSAGQYTIVFPEQDAVLSINGDVTDMQRVLDIVWDRMLPAFAKAALPEDAASAAALRDRTATLALKPVAGARAGGDEFLGKVFPFKEAPAGIKDMRLDRTSDGWTFRVTTPAGVQAVPVGFGSWARGRMRFSTRKHEPLGEIVGEREVATSAAVQGDGSIALRMHLLGGTHRMDIRFCRKLFRPTIEGGMNNSSGAFKTKLW